MPEPSGLSGVIELAADALLREPAPEIGEQELCRPSVARMRERPPVGADLDDPVDHVQDLGIKGNHAFGGELAERDFQPCPIPIDLVNAVQFQVEEFPDPQPAGALQPQP